MKTACLSACALSLLLGLTACGGSKTTGSTESGSSGSSSGAAADFTLSIAPTALTLTPGGSSQVAIAAAAVNGFTGNVSVTVGALPAGVSATPMTLSLAAGAVQQVTVAAAPTTAVGSFSLALQGASGALSHSVSSAVAIKAAAANVEQQLIQFRQ